MDTVEIFITGKKYRVPSVLTVQKAMEYVGFQIVRGCGCRGGVCGACVMIYRTPASTRLRTALACVTLAEDGMTIVNVPYFPARKEKYDIDELMPTAEDIRKAYPEISACMGCNTCTKMCPQGVPIMEVVSAALRGEIARAAQLSSQCVMCGLCAARCPAELPPHNIGLLSRRLYARHILPPYPHVIDRLKQLDRGDYDEEMDRIGRLRPEELKEEYSRAQADKQVI